MLDLVDSARAEDIDAPHWSEAEVFDAPLAHDQAVRAVVLRLGAHKWQWTISSLEHDGGQLISSGVERTAAAARETATAEIAKCLEDALG